MPNPPPLAETKSHTRVGPWSLMGCDQGRAIWKQQLGTGHWCTVCRNGSGGSRSRWQGLGRREVSPGGVCHPKSRDGTALPPAGLLERMAPPRWVVLTPSHSEPQRAGSPSPEHPLTGSEPRSRESEGSSRLLQGFHQRLAGLDADLDLSPGSLVRRSRQLRLCLLQVCLGRLQWRGVGRQSSGVPGLVPAPPPPKPRALGPCCLLGASVSPQTLTPRSSMSSVTASSASNCTDESAFTVTEPLLTAGGGGTSASRHEGSHRSWGQDSGPTGAWGPV